MRTYSGLVTELGTHEIFVFGSNLSGFHGAGSAGYASFGIMGNHWRKFDYASKPDGWRGKWNVKGRGEGLQHGTDGWSYALPTVTKAGAKRSRRPGEITDSIIKLYNCARRNGIWTFYIAQGAKQGLNGYSADEMASMYLSAGKVPANVRFSGDFAELMV